MFRAAPNTMRFEEAVNSALLPNPSKIYFKIIVPTLFKIYNNIKNITVILYIDYDSQLPYESLCDV